MFTLLTSLVAPTATPILLLSYLCQSGNRSSDSALYELTIAGNMARGRMISQVTQSITDEATKSLSQAEIVELRHNIARLPAPFSNFIAYQRPPSAQSFASLRLVAGELAWNVTLPPTDRQWEAFEPVLHWIELINQTQELRQLHADRVFWAVLHASVGDWRLHLGLGALH